MRGLTLLLLLPPAAGAQSAAEILERVARNQDRAVRLRASFVYDQNVLIRLQRGNRKLAREEMHDFVVTPTPDGIRRERVKFSGKAIRKGREIPVERPGQELKEMDIDAELAGDLVEDFTEEKRDGVAAELFPLTAEEQKNYRFRLAGRQRYQSRDAYRFTFKPASDRRPWAGEALIDAAECQPVLVTTWLARGVSVAVRVLLGTNLKHLGFKVTYDKFADGVWFPISYGGEFQLRAVFFYKRIISLSVRNSGFKRTDVESTIQYDTERPPAESQ